MNELLYLIVIGILGLIIVAQIFERFNVVDHYQKEKDKMLDEQSRLVKAIIAKNANDYVMTTSIDKVAPETKQPNDPDLIDPDDLTDDEFVANIGKSLKN